MEKTMTRSYRGLWRPILLLALVIGMLAAAHFLGLGQRLGELRQWIRGLGPLGPGVFVLLYMVAVVAAVPGSALTVMAGALFGSVLGVVLVSLASTAGATLAFLAARYFARNAVARWLEKNESFRKLDRMTERHGAIMVALTRLVPIFPFNLLNYGFGLTRVTLATYVFWSWLCMLPGTVLYVVGADAVIQALALGRVPWVLVAVVVGVLGLLVVLARHARARLRMDAEPEPPTPSL